MDPSEYCECHACRKWLPSGQLWCDYCGYRPVVKDGKLLHRDFYKVKVLLVGETVVFGNPEEDGFEKTARDGMLEDTDLWSHSPDDSPQPVVTVEAVQLKKLSDLPPYWDGDECAWCPDKSCELYISRIEEDLVADRLASEAGG